jgi:hypothetical protein
MKKHTTNRSAKLHSGEEVILTEKSKLILLNHKFLGIVKFHCENLNYI